MSDRKLTTRERAEGRTLKVGGSASPSEGPFRNQIGEIEGKMLESLLNRGWWTACYIGETRMMCHRRHGVKTMSEAARLEGL